MEFELLGAEHNWAATFKDVRCISGYGKCTALYHSMLYNVVPLAGCKKTKWCFYSEVVCGFGLRLCKFFIQHWNLARLKIMQIYKYLDVWASQVLLQTAVAAVFFKMTATGLLIPHIVGTKIRITLILVAKYGFLDIRNSIFMLQIYFGQP